MAGVTEYIDRNSLIHRLNPLSKLSWALGIMVLALTFNDVLYLLVLLGMVVVVGLMGRVLLNLVFVLKGLVIFASMLVLLQILFFQGHEVLFYLLPHEGLPITKKALLLGIAMGLRMITVVLSFLIFLATTQFKDILLVLTEKIRLPYDYVFMFMTALRFVPTFLDEAVQVRYAQQVRGCPVDSGNPWNKLKAYQAVALPLVLMSLKKAERLAIAMETRGYGCGKRTYYQEPVLTKMDSFVMVMAFTTVVLAIYFRFQGYGTVIY